MSTPNSHYLINPEAMAEIDAATAESGIAITSLMEKAGQAVAASALRYYPDALRFIVLCGTGNNGGDGFVAARALLASCAQVSVYVLGGVTKLRGAARWAYEGWAREVQPLTHYVPQNGDVVIDAVFGAGLSRDVPEALANVIEAVAAADIPVIAVDLPSGVCGRRGVVLGAAFRAERTVTFAAKKPGHVLMPGRSLCGELEIFDIGIPKRIVAAHAGAIRENHPDLWKEFFSRRDEDTHKFKRGHLTVFSGPSHATGAARMTAIAGLRAGAGIVSIAAPQEAVPVLAATLTAIMVSPVDDRNALTDWREDKRHATYVLGPGFGDMEKAREFVSLLADKSLILDADGISAFRQNPEDLFSLFAKADAARILTPHEGEFARLFPDIHSDNSLSKIEKAQAAAALAHAVIIYKGADTVIAAPDGRAYVNTNAPATLATAGSGDVLAGICGGFLAQQIPAFEAAAAAVWLHGETARTLGEGLTAEDLASAVRPFDFSR